ncbi:MAG: SatD family protein [Planctomycetota bacterium]
MANIGKDTESGFTAVTADLVGSRSSPDRAALQARLIDALASISEELQRSLVADVQLTAGDEVQALLRTPCTAMRLLQQLADVVHPTQFAFGIGFGALSTPLPARRAARKLPLLDGPCFHRARAALQEAQKRDVWAVAEGFCAWQVPLNALLELLGNLRRNWTEKQGLYAAAARDTAQKDVAQRFGVSPSVVSESLKGARLELLRRGEGGVEALLQHFAEQQQQQQFAERAESAATSAATPNRRPTTRGRR